MSAIIEFEMPFVVFLGDPINALYAKTGLGRVHWCREQCAGHMRLPGCGVDADVPHQGGLTHALTLAQAARDQVLKFTVGSMGGSSLAMAPAFVIQPAVWGEAR